MPLLQHRKDDEYFMTTEQIYSLVNLAAQESMGSVALQANDASSLVSLGNAILSSQTNTEAFLNTLVQRIGRTIVSYRAYRNKFSKYIKSSMEWGAIMQKVKASMPQAVEDPTYSLTNGQSVDPWTVYKPDVKQKLFVKRSPFMIPLTIQRITLREAFLSPDAMETFIGAIFGEVRNYIELSNENMGRATLANMIAESSGGTQTINLVANYNKATGESLTAGTAALYDEAFLRYAIAQINLYSDKLTDMSIVYNKEGEERHTPYEDQFMVVNTEFERALQTQVQWAAFNEQYVRMMEGYIKSNYWQASKSPLAIQVNRASDDEDTTVNNIVAVIHDRDALGMYSEEEDVLTTPVNAKARYYNTFWHIRNQWFNDLSENCLVFTLN